MVGPHGQGGRRRRDDASDPSYVPAWDALEDAVVAAHADGTIVFANLAAEVLLGWDRGSLIGRVLTDIIPDRFRQAHAAAFHRHMTGRPSGLVGRTLGVPALRQDGTEVEVGLVLSAAPDGVVIGVLRRAGSRVDVEGPSALPERLLPVLAEASDVAAATGAMLEVVAETLGYDVAVAWNVETDQLHCTAVWEHPARPAPSFSRISRTTTFPPLIGLPGRVWASREPAWITDLATDEGFTRRSHALDDGLATAVAFPLLHNEEITGAVELFSRSPRAVDPSLLRTLRALGRELGGFLAARHAEAERRELLRREHVARVAAEKANAEATELARILQQSLLPPSLPVIAGLEIAGRYHPAGEGLEVGGDFYDVFQTAPNAWAFSIGDVCGKGAPAAALTALVRYTARAAAMQTASPARVLALVNEAMVRDTRTRADERQAMFVTMAYGVVSRTDGDTTIALACGGHPAPQVLRASGVVEQAPCQGALLGIYDDPAISEHTFRLDRGDALVLYTDGITEAPGPFGRVDEEGLRALLEACHGLDAESIAGRLEATALMYQGGRSRDDIAALVIRVADQ